MATKLKDPTVGQAPIVNGPAEKPKPKAYRTEDIGGIVRGLTSQDSPWMRQAETAGLQRAASRGLTNSSMAVGAAQDEVHKAALPLAQTKYQGNLAHNLQKQQSRDAKEMAWVQYRQNRKLSRQDFLQNRKIQNRDLTFRRNEADREREQQKLLQDDQQSYLTGQNEADRDIQKLVASWNLGASEQSNAMQALSGFNSLYQNTIANINANKDLSGPARTAQLKAAEAMLKKQTKMVENLYAIQIPW